MKELKINASLLKEAAGFIWAEDHSLRQRLLLLLYYKGEMSVKEIYKAMHIEQSVASLQLGILRKAGLVTQTRQGQQIFYSIHLEQVFRIQDIARLLIEKPPDQ